MLPSIIDVATLPTLGGRATFELVGEEGVYRADDVSSMPSDPQLPGRMVYRLDQLQLDPGMLEWLVSKHVESIEATVELLQIPGLVEKVRAALNSHEPSVPWRDAL